MIAKLLGWCAPYLLPIAGGLLVFSFLFGGYQKWQAGRYKAKAAEVQMLWDAERGRMYEAAAKESEARATETARRLRAYQEAKDASEIRAKNARNDAVAAGNAADRLRRRTEELAASCGSGISNPETPTVNATEAGRVLADMLGRVVDFARRVSQYADQSSNDADHCEAAAGALTK